MLIKQEEFDMTTFDQIVTQKSALIEKLELLDSGFESVYDRKCSDIFVCARNKK